MRTLADKMPKPSAAVTESIVATNVAPVGEKARWHPKTRTVSGKLGLSLGTRTARGSGGSSSLRRRRRRVGAVAGGRRSNGPW